jgi:hypothetical protein
VVTRVGTGAVFAAFSACAQVWLGLDGDELVHARRIVLEVDPVTGPELYHPTVRAGEQLAAQVALPGAAGAADGPDSSKG